MSNHNSERGGGGFFPGFIAGVIIGAVAAYLITQEEARDMIVGKAREAGNMAASWQSNAVDLYARGKDVVEKARSSVSSAVEEGQSASDRLRDHLSQDAGSSSEVLGADGGYKG